MDELRLSEHFRKDEMECHCGCGMVPASEFMQWLEGLRKAYGSPMLITSGARCQKHNQAVGGASDSMHVKGLACDVRISGTQAFKLMALAHLWGVKGLGVKQHGPDRFIHLDIGPRETPMVWSYP